MGSLALSRAEVLDQPAPSIAGEVARIAREQLAPLAAGIDAGTVYPAEVLRQFEDVLYPALSRKHTAMPVVPPGARQSTTPGPGC
jgi:hypothetical protein